MTWKMRPIVTRHRGLTWRRDITDTHGCHEVRTTVHGPRLRERIYALGFAVGLIIGLWEVLSVEGYVVMRIIIVSVTILTAVLMVLEGDP